MARVVGPARRSAVGPRFSPGPHSGVRLSPPRPVLELDRSHCGRCGGVSHPPVWSPRDSPETPSPSAMSQSAPTARDAAANSVLPGTVVLVRRRPARVAPLTPSFGSGPVAYRCPLRTPTDSQLASATGAAGAGPSPWSQDQCPEEQAAAAGECACCPPEGDDGVRFPGAARTLTYAQGRVEGREFV